MLRFTNAICKDDYINIIVEPEKIIFDENIWYNIKRKGNNNVNIDVMSIQVWPFITKDNKLNGYLYQDEEANRELRMLKELENNEDAYQFNDIYPNIHKVIIIGCNELAFLFAKYLEKQKVMLELVGEYWNYLGYESTRAYEFNEHVMVIHAEGRKEISSGIIGCITDSISSEFECINNIYEKNVIDEKIKNTGGDFYWFLNTIRNRQIFLLGTDDDAQDTYDILYSKDIDICGFLQIDRGYYKAIPKRPSLETEFLETEINKNKKRLLGKAVCHIDEILNEINNPIFINCKDKYSALGARDIEFLYEFGYERNKDVFFIKDYVEIPHNNLIHILKNKDVLLAGDEKWCQMLSEYLYKIEEGKINAKYTDLTSKINCSEDTIMCYVHPWNGTYGGVEEKQNYELCYKKIIDNEFYNYTEYFSSMKSIYLIDDFGRNNRTKYVEWLRPKGIVIAKIPWSFGNTFIAGILDGHPEIIRMGFGAFTNNLYQYCIRLSVMKSSDIIKEFWKMYTDEATRIRVGIEFIDIEYFNNRVEEMLVKKEYFTSQELFVLFNIAYTEMYNNKIKIDISKYIIYWECHFFPRDEVDFLVKWLESDKINGYTLTVLRDNSVRLGSGYGLNQNAGRIDYIDLLDTMFYNGHELVRKMPYNSWDEIQIRFEDVKIKSKESLETLCEKLKIAWSDNMLSTTEYGEEYGYKGSVGFDLQPVFKRSENIISEFDRLRIYIACGEYQKRYGYPYESCIKFTRKELFDMFKKPFLFQEKLIFSNDREKIQYNLSICDRIKWKLWDVRKAEILESQSALFKPLEYGQSIEKCKRCEKRIADRVSNEYTKIQEIEKKKVLDFIVKNNNIIMYGTGKDCDGILQYLDETKKSKLQFSDRKAEREGYVYQDKIVIHPSKLVKEYNNYKILITSSRYYKIIKYELERMGIFSDNIFCNTVQFWYDE